MPIGMQQWRVQIGVLEAQRHRYLSRATRKAARRRARGCRAGRINPGKATYSRMVVGITLLGLVVSLSLLLLKAGDVERNPGPLPDELLSQVDDSELTENDLYSVYQEVVSLAGEWRSMCFALWLQDRDASIIAARYPNNPKECLRAVLLQWLKKGYEVWKYGSPSWWNMVQAIAEPSGGNNYALAQNIATRHQAQAVAFMRQPSIQLHPPAAEWPRTSGTQSHQQQMMVGRLPGGGGQMLIHPAYQQHTQLSTGQRAMQQQIGFMPPASRHVSTPQVVAGGISTHAQRIQQQQSMQQQTTTQQAGGLDSSQQQLSSTYTYDSTSGFYYDSATGLYYDPRTQYHYDSRTGHYCYYDPNQQAYIPVASDGTPIPSASIRIIPTPSRTFPQAGVRDSSQQQLPSTYTYDYTCGFHYDSATGLYYDSKTQYHYNSQSRTFCYYDPNQQAYIPVASDGTPITSTNTIRSTPTAAHTQGARFQQQQATQNIGGGVAGVGGPQMMHPAAYQQQTREPMGGVVWGAGSHMINPGFIPTGAMAYSGMAPQGSHHVTLSSSPPPLKRQKLNSGCNQAQAIPSDSHLPPLAGQQRVGSDSPLQVYSNGVKECYKQSHTEVPVQYWPHLKQAKFINLALLKADKFSLSDEYSMGTIMGSADDIYAKKEEVTYSELFTSVESGARILIEGRPGCGKTTLINKVSRDWALGDILKKISVLILVPLRRFHSKPQIRLEDILRLYDPGTLTTPVLDEIISTAGEGVCIAFDGLDEYANSTSEDGFIMDLWHRKLLPRAVVIITSRPAASQKLRPNASRHVEILGFLRKQIVQYVQEYYGNDNEKAKKLLSYLERYKNIRHICYIPLHLAMVVHLNDHLSQRNEPLPRTETEVYLKFTRYILIRDMDRDPTCLSSRLDSLENLPSDRLDAFREICSLAYRGTINSEHIFSQLDAKVLLGVQHINLTSLGLLTVDSQFTDCGLDETYSFFHLTHQEFLGAYYITKLGDEDQVQAFVQYGEERNMSVVWRFYCGLTNAQGNAARDVYKRMIASGKLSALQLLQYTYESHEKSACSELIASTGGKLILQDESLNPADCSAISFCIQNASHSLTEIELHSCHITSDAFAVFPDEIQSPVSNVRRLCLSHTMVPRKALCSLVKLLKKLPNLQILELTKCTSRLQSTEELVQVLKELQCLNTLSTDMSTAKTFGGVTKLLSDVPTLKSLRIDGSALALEVSRTSDQSSIRLLNAKKETVLIDTLRAADSWTIEIVNLKLTESDVQLLGEALKQSPTLKTLSIDAGVRCVAEFFNSSPLHETVSIWENGHTVAEIRRQLPSTPDSEICYCLERNACSRWNDCHRTITHLLTDLPEFSKFRVSIVESSLPAVSQSLDLDTISLFSAGIGDRGAAVLGALIKHCPSLQTLNLSWNSIGDRGLEGLVQGLQYCTSLQKLDLRYNSITDGSADYLAQLGRALPSLKELDLSLNSIGDGGLEGLVQGLQYCTSLQKLDLGGNSIGDRGLEGLLEGLQHCSSLQTLDLQHNNISDDSVDQLAQFVRDLPSLKSLEIWGNKLSDRGKDVLKQIEKERPGLSIRTDWF